MILKKFLILLTGLAALACCSFSFAQERVHAVTKHIDKRMEYKKGEGLVVLAEKSKISITTWDKDYIELNLELTSRHARLEVAKAELEYLKYRIEKRDSEHIIKNYFQAKDNLTRVKGTLSSEYTLKVPEGCPVSVTNLYGELTANDLKSDLEVKVRFVDVKLYRPKGKIQMESYFGNVRMENGEGDLFATLEKSKVNILSFSGRVDIKSSYGEIEIGNGHYKKFDIKGDRTAVIWTAESLNQYNYHLSSYASDIYVPKEMGPVDNDNKNVNLIKNNGDNKVWINIETTYSPITIKPNNNNVSKK